MIKGRKLGFYNVDIFIVLVLLFSLVVGILIADDYGLSWDEYKSLSYGEVVLKAYQGSEDFLWKGGILKYYGPFYWMLVGFVSSLVNSLPFDVQIVYVWKILNFIAFQVGVLSFYYLSKRFLSRIPALFTTTLFMTQPLLWGHAFINPKDIPFMSFFVLCITLSLRGFDAFNSYLRSTGDPLDKWLERVTDKWFSLRQSWKATSGQKKTMMGILIALFIIITFELLFFKSVFLPIAHKVVRDAYHGESIPLVNSLFESIAQDAYKTPVDLYLWKLNRLYGWLRWLIICSLALIVYIFCRRHLSCGPSKFDWKDFFRKSSFFIIPGIIFGMTISIRVVGLFVGVLFSVYFLWKLRWKAMIPLLFYWGVALLVTYTTWPYLWGSFFARFFESIKIVGSFTNETLFQGKPYLSGDTPIQYLPFLIAVQLTEPAIILFVVGLLLLVKMVKRNEVDFAEILILAGWLGLPILSEILFRIPIYDNFRQFLFILPPLFIFAGFGISFLWEKLDRYRLGILGLVVIMLPGFIGLFQLHPYEYVYYNTFVGGASMVYGEYELDYWCTSLRETMEFLNENAEPNSDVYISGPPAAAEPFARKDLKITNSEPLPQSTGYVVGCRTILLRDDYFPDSKVIYKVGIDGGLFAVVKILEPELIQR